MVCLCGLNVCTLSSFFFLLLYQWHRGQFYSTELLQKWLTRLILLECHSILPFRQAPQPDTMSHAAALWKEQWGQTPSAFIFYKCDEPISRQVFWDSYFLAVNGTWPLQQTWKERSRPQMTSGGSVFRKALTVPRKERETVRESERQTWSGNEKWMETDPPWFKQWHFNITCHSYCEILKIGVLS